MTTYSNENIEAKNSNTRGVNAIPYNFGIIIESVIIPSASAELIIRINQIEVTVNKVIQNDKMNQKISILLKGDNDNTVRIKPIEPKIIHIESCIDLVFRS